MRMPATDGSSVCKVPQGRPAHIKKLPIITESADELQRRMKSEIDPKRQRLHALYLGASGQARYRKEVPPCSASIATASPCGLLPTPRAAPPRPCETKMRYHQSPGVSRRLPVPPCQTYARPHPALQPPTRGAAGWPQCLRGSWRMPVSTRWGGTNCVPHRHDRARRRQKTSGI
jgi:hypothetical protein